MYFEWDEAKRQLNVRNHGVDLAYGALIFEGPTVESPDMRSDYGEERIVAIGLARGTFLVVVYTKRGDTIRLISTRRGGRRDRRKYEKAISG